MKPIEETKTITVYKCADCGKEHGDARKCIALRDEHGKLFLPLLTLRRKPKGAT